MAIVRKIRRSLKREGVLKTVALCFRNLLPHRNLDDQPSQFDLQYGVATAGRVELGDLNIDSPSNIWGVRYSPTPTAIFDGILALLPPPEGYSFIDLGAGKGRVILMAARKPFRNVIGIEFSRELCDIAEANVAKFGPNIAAGSVRVVCQDAALFEFPEGPLIVYCYFAFGEQVLLRVLDHLSRRQDETLFVFYNFHYPELFSQFELLHSEGVLRISRIPARDSKEHASGNERLAAGKPAPRA